MSVVSLRRRRFSGLEFELAYKIGQVTVYRCNKLNACAWAHGAFSTSVCCQQGRAAVTLYPHGVSAEMSLLCFTYEAHYF